MPLLLLFLRVPALGRNETGLRWPMLYVTREGLMLPLGPLLVRWKA